MRIGAIGLHPVSDGTFVARPEYFGAGGSPVPHPEFFSRDGAAWLPIGCFLLRAGQRLVLIDAGLGPDLQHLPHGMYLVVGQLCDWHHFVAGPGEMLPHIREGFRAQALSGRLHLIDRDTTVAAGITARLAPGHTPGHLCVVMSSGRQRAILLGDAITCPIQLDEPAWQSFGDVDPVLAAQTREGLWHELEDEHTTGAGAHFPEIRFGRVRTGAAGRRFSYAEGDPR
jgi:hypothetical protein